MLLILARFVTIILHSKLYSVCPSKYQDQSKPLKHLPINIWSETNTFIWLIPVVAVQIKKIIQNISRTKQDMKNR